MNNAEDAKALSLSRVGDFRFDSDGYLVDGAGNVVYGFVTCNMDGADQADEAGTNGDGISTQLVPIRLPMKAVGDAAQGDIKPGTPCSLVWMTPDTMFRRRKERDAENSHR